MRAFVLFFGTLLAVDVLYFIIAWSLPPYGSNENDHWDHVWKLIISGGIGVALVLVLTVKALARHRYWMK